LFALTRCQRGISIYYFRFSPGFYLPGQCVRVTRMVCARRAAIYMILLLAGAGILFDHFAVVVRRPFRVALWATVVFARLRVISAVAKMIVGTVVRTENRGRLGVRRRSVLRASWPCQTAFRVGFRQYRDKERIDFRANFVREPLTAHPILRKALMQFQFKFWPAADHADACQLCRPVPDEGRNPMLYISGRTDLDKPERGSFNEVYFNRGIAREFAKRHFIPINWVARLLFSKRPQICGSQFSVGFIVLLTCAHDARRRRGTRARADEARNVEVNDGVVLLLVRIIDVPNPAEAFAERLRCEALGLEFGEKLLEVIADRGLFFLKAEPALITGAQDVVRYGFAHPATPQFTER